MTKLRDMEELIEDIIDINMKSYMREALTCYMTDAYRACIVLSFIAIFENIFKKLEGLSYTNKTAREIYKDICTKRENQKVYENILLERLKSEKIISELDAGFLEVLRVLRNKAAHPSGHSPSAEEARFVFSETITRFLSKPILSTTQVADSILAKLPEEYLFPTNVIQDHVEVVHKEISPLHQDAYAYVLKKLLTFEADKNQQISTNSKRYILGMCYSPINEELLTQIKKHIIEKASIDGNKRKLILECVSSNANVIKGVDSIVLMRIKKMLQQTIKDTKSSDQHLWLIHPVQIIRSLTSLGQDFLSKHFNDEVESIINEYCLSPVLIRAVKDDAHYKSKLITAIFGKAGSASFEEANNFARNSHSYEKSICYIMSDKECFQLLIEVTNSANRGAYGSEALVKGKFLEIPTIKAKAISALASELESCNSILQEVSKKAITLEKFKTTYIE